MGPSSGSDLGLRSLRLQIFTARRVNHPQLGQRLINLRALLFQLGNLGIGALNHLVQLLGAAFALVAANRELIRRMEAKAKAAIDRVWGAA